MTSLKEGLVRKLLEAGALALLTTLADDSGYEVLDWLSHDLESNIIRFSYRALEGEDRDEQILTVYVEEEDDVENLVRKMVFIFLNAIL